MKDRYGVPLKNGDYVYVLARIDGSSSGGDPDRAVPVTFPGSLTSAHSSYLSIKGSYVVKLP